MFLFFFFSLVTLRSYKTQKNTKKPIDGFSTSLKKLTSDWTQSYNFLYFCWKINYLAKLQYIIECIPVIFYIRNFVIIYVSLFNASWTLLLHLIFSTSDGILFLVFFFISLLISFLTATLKFWFSLFYLI